MMSGFGSPEDAAARDTMGACVLMPVRPSVTVVSIVSLPSLFPTSERGGLQLFAQDVSYDDRREVQRDDDDEEKDRGRVDHRDGRFDVRALEAHVVEMESEVHDLPLEVQKREDAVDRQRGRELDDAHDHERRDFARAARHREDQSRQDTGRGRGQYDAPRRLPLRGAERERSVAHARGDRGEGFLRGHDDDGHREDGERQGAPDDAAGAERGRRQGLGEEDLVDVRADAVDEEAEPEDAEDDRRDAGEVVHGDPHESDDPALLRVFAKVERGDDAERHGDDAHEHDHQNRPEDGREDAALGVRLPRLVEHELADAREVDADLLHNRFGVRLDDAHHAEDRNRLALSLGVDECGTHRGVLLAAGLEALADLLVAALELGLLGLIRDAAPCETGILLELGAPEREPIPLEGGVDGPNVLLLGLPQLFEGGTELFLQVPQPREPSGVGAAEHLVSTPDVLQESMKIAVLLALDEERVRGRIRPDDVFLLDPAKVESVQVPIRDLHADAHRRRLLLRVRHGFARKDLAEHFPAVLRLDLDEGVRPEEAEAPHGDEREQPENEQQRDRQARAGEPDHRLALPEEELGERRAARRGRRRDRFGVSGSGHQMTVYFLRSRWRSASASVLTRKVTTKSRRAARKSTRYSVPPWGASGISTAMFAARVRMPLKMFQSRMGVLPVAISTIIVSPTARPKPTIRAEKIPAEAVGRITRIAVCHGEAPSCLLYTSDAA